MNISETQINETARKQIENIAQLCYEKKPLVAIQCITFNHESYIREALEGFVMQKTNFPFVAIVHDDASTDGTANLIREYAEKYPDIILPIFEKENQYSKRNGSLTKIMNKACEVTGAKYVAMCEGDDYWIDATKLQKQVDFLETHNDYSYCGHNVVTKVEANYKGRKIIFNNIEGTYSKKAVLSRWIIPTCSIVCRWQTLKTKPTHKDFMVGDYILSLHCILEGKFFLFGNPSGVYRLNGTGWTAVSSQRQESYIRHLLAVKESFKTKTGFQEIEPIINRQIDNSRIRIIESNFRRNRKVVIETFKEGIKGSGVKFIFTFLVKIPKDTYKSLKNRMLKH